MCDYLCGMEDTFFVKQTKRLIPDFIEEVPSYHTRCGVLGGGMIPKNRAL